MNPHQLLEQMNVNKDPRINEQLTTKSRLSNIEGDIIHQRDAVAALVAQNQIYIKYINTEMAIKEDSSKFWKDVRKKLTVSGIWGTIILIISAIAYAAKHYIETH